MNIPYTCHNCGTEFDILPDYLKEIRDKSDDPGACIQARCPGCTAAGKPPHVCIYTLNVEGDEPVLVSSPWAPVG